MFGQKDREEVLGRKICRFTSFCPAIFLPNSWRGDGRELLRHGDNFTASARQVRADMLELARRAAESQRSNATRLSADNQGMPLIQTALTLPDDE